MVYGRRAPDGRRPPIEEVGTRLAERLAVGEQGERSTLALVVPFHFSTSGRPHHAVATSGIPDRCGRPNAPGQRGRAQLAAKSNCGERPHEAVATRIRSLRSWPCNRERGRACRQDRPAVALVSPSDRGLQSRGAASAGRETGRKPLAREGLAAREQRWPTILNGRGRFARVAGSRSDRAGDRVRQSSRDETTLVEPDLKVLGSFARKFPYSEAPRPRLLPDVVGTTCGQHLEKVIGTEHTHILRVPFRTEKGIVRKWISRFKVWPYLETYADDVANELARELQATPDLIVGNYSDENLNILVVSKYYSRITMTRLSDLLCLSLQETEKYLSEMVVASSLIAKIDRLMGVVCFQTAKDNKKVLNLWSMNLERLRDLVEKSCHQIHKECMVHKAVLRA
ncbi:hypothetical protein KSP40_PGU021906 [Platanthera guangdongensis]|uniref:sucrose synthase n=1 Tax=Platanthera guangdongensis TaxID=2320717 RepID=A0ABR2N311_9ASPA